MLKYTSLSNFMDFLSCESLFTLKGVAKQCRYNVENEGRRIIAIKFIIY